MLNSKDMSENKITEWETLMERALGITDLPLDQITHEDMLELRKISLKISYLVYSLSVIIWETKSKYKLKYWDELELWTGKNKSITLSKEIATTEAEREFWEYRKMEEARDWMIWVLKQIEWYSVQWNMYRKEQNSYLDSIK